MRICIRSTIGVRLHTVAAGAAGSGRQHSAAIGRHGLLNQQVLLIDTATIAQDPIHAFHQANSKDAVLCPHLQPPLVNKSRSDLGSLLPHRGKMALTSSGLTPKALCPNGFPLLPLFKAASALLSHYPKIKEPKVQKVLRPSAGLPGRCTSQRVRWTKP